MFLARRPRARIAPMMPQPMIAISRGSSSMSRGEISGSRLVVGVEVWPFTKGGNHDGRRRDRMLVSMVIIRMLF